MKKATLLVFTIFILMSCKSKIVTTEIKTEPAITTVTEMTMTDMIAKGESLYKNKCGNCHDLPNVKAYTPENWKPIMLRMQKQAGLSDSERDYVYNYIIMQ